MPTSKSSRLRIRPKLTGQEKSFYHVVSRFCDRRHAFQESEKQCFYDLMRAYEAFGCLRILSYCLMSNHFHILVEVSARPEARPGEVELLAHVEATLGKKIADEHRAEIAWLREAALRQQNDAVRGEWRRLGGAEGGWGLATSTGGELSLVPPADCVANSPPPQPGKTWHEQEIEARLDRIWRRMHDISCFGQSLKQRFTVWYNQKHDRVGTLWEERFRSTIIEGGSALAEVSAYIDLNPVRAGLVDDPKDYRWSQYGAAMAGQAMQRDAVEEIVDTFLAVPHAEASHAHDWDQVQGWYRMLLYRRGLQAPVANGSVSGVFPPEVVAAVLDQEGRVSGVSYAKLRVRHFTQGLAIGSKAFVDRLFQENREHFGEKRRTGARRMRAAPEPGDSAHSAGHFGELRSLRDLG